MNHVNIICVFFSGAKHPLIVDLKPWLPTVHIHIIYIYVQLYFVFKILQNSCRLKSHAIFLRKIYIFSKKQVMPLMFMYLQCTIIILLNMMVDLWNSSLLFYILMYKSNLQRLKSTTRTTKNDGHVDAVALDSSDSSQLGALTVKHQHKHPQV